MNLRELCEYRYSVRTFLSQDVEKSKIEYILNCAGLAPSACNFQPWIFYIITDSTTKSKLQESYNREWFRSAPLYVVVCKDSSQSWKRSTSDGKDFGDVDAAIAAEHICLASAEVGLGTCWVCNFNPEIVSEALGLPGSLEPIAIFPIGYIDTEKSKTTDKKRKLITDITRWI